MQAYIFVMCGGVCVQVYVVCCVHLHVYVSVGMCVHMRYACIVCVHLQVFMCTCRTRACVILSVYLVCTYAYGWVYIHTGACTCVHIQPVCGGVYADGDCVCLCLHLCVECMGEGGCVLSVLELGGSNGIGDSKRK